METLERKTIPLDKIKIPQIRVTAQFDEETLAYLKSSVEQKGFLDPILVRTLEDGSYELIDGLHRMEALKERGIQEVDALLKSMSDKDALDYNISTSISKGTTNPVEVGIALQKLIEGGETSESLAQKYGKNVRWINLYLHIGNMGETYQDALKRGKLSIGVIEKALVLEDDTEINQALDYAILYSYTIKEMERYVVQRKEDIQRYQEHVKELGLDKATITETPPEKAYLTKCGGCGEEVDSRFIRGIVLCKSCLYALNLIYQHFGSPVQALPELEKFIREAEEKSIYERLKRKYEPERPEEKKEPESQPPPGKISSF